LLQPSLLEDNLSELELLLADDAVRKDEKLWSTNQSSLSNLKLFLQQYTAALMKVDTEYLPRQRHVLEFIVRCVRGWRAHPRQPQGCVSGG